MNLGYLYTLTLELDPLHELDRNHLQDDIQPHDHRGHDNIEYLDLEVIVQIISTQVPTHIIPSISFSWVHKPFVRRLEEPDLRLKVITITMEIRSGNLFNGYMLFIHGHVVEPF